MSDCRLTSCPHRVVDEVTSAATEARIRQTVEATSVQTRWRGVTVPKRNVSDRSVMTSSWSSDGVSNGGSGGDPASLYCSPLTKRWMCTASHDPFRCPENSSEFRSSTVLAYLTTIQYCDLYRSVSLTEFTILRGSFGQTKFIARRPVHARRATKVEPAVQVSREWRQRYNKCITDRFFCGQVSRLDDVIGGSWSEQQCCEQSTLIC